MWFTRISINNPVLATMVMLALVVLGLFSYQRLKVDQFPEIDLPTVVIQLDYPGASPAIVETEVTRKVEEAVNTVAGISQLYSRSYEGSSVVIIQFNLDVDGRRATDDVREKLSIIRPLLRDEVKEPRVLRFDPSNRPIFSLALTSPDHSRSAMELSTYGDQILKKRLENVRGVGSVSLVGPLKREINVYLHPQAMEALGITPELVLTTLRNENQEQPAGSVRTRQQDRVVQINARLKQADDFRQLVLSSHHGQTVRLSQVAEVVDGPQEVDSLALLNGQRTVALEVLKAQGENTIEVVTGLRQAVHDAQADLPMGIHLEVVRDNSRPISVSVSTVRDTLIEGAVLTIGIVFLFLNSWRSTVITGLTLPISIIGTFLFMHALGFSINMVTLMALSLCVGLLIDDAIVVRENIVRHAQMGKSALQASLDGTREIGLAVLATTLSIVAVFLPIGFMGGIIGKFFHEFGITIVAAVLISMFVSFTLDPMLSSIWPDPAIHRPHGATATSWYDRSLGRLTGWVEHLSERLSEQYQSLLDWSLGHPGLTLLVAIASLVGSFALMPLMGTEFVPKADYSETFVTFYTPAGSSIESTEARTREVDALIRQQSEVSYTLATINTGAALGRNQVSIYVRLKDRQLRQRNVDQLSAPLRSLLSSIPGITVTHVGLLDAVGGLKPIQLSIQGSDLAQLDQLTQRTLDQLRHIPGLVDLDTSLKPKQPTLDIVVRRDAAADLGLSVGGISNTLNTLVAGKTVGSWRAEDGQNYDIKLSLSPEARRTASDLTHLPLIAGQDDTGAPRIVRLHQVADIIEGQGPTQINRRDLNREVEITANVAGRSMGEISADIQKVLDNTAWPLGYRNRFGGSTKDMKEAFAYAISALALAVIFIYMILASQFRSFLQPIALMSSLPLTLIGVVVTLLMFGSTLNIFSIIGIIMLMGLVTKNAILLIDFTNRAREGHSGEADQTAPLERRAALLLAARVRLRPILMTTLAMVFGMLPLAFGLGEGQEQRAPMGQAVIGGVIASSLLTLVVVPVVYCYLDDLAQWSRRRLK
ncbi:MAG: efflux RND transporter permease subunit [Burkholderiales bacterium]|nr:efflux RND transporter permease subunit [Burkholderiales bacterium]